MALDREFSSAQEMRAHYIAVRRRIEEAGRRFVPAPSTKRTHAFGEGFGVLADAQRAANARAERQSAAEAAERARARIEDRRLLGPAILQNPPQRTIEYIAFWHGITAAEVVGPRRTKAMVAARFDALRAIHERHPDRSLHWYGKHLGGRDHTTILSALVRMGIRSRREGAKPR